MRINRVKLARIAIVWLNGEQQQPLVLYASAGKASVNISEMIAEDTRTMEKMDGVEFCRNAVKCYGPIKLGERDGLWLTRMAWQMGEKRNGKIRFACIG